MTVSSWQKNVRIGWELVVEQVKSILGQWLTSTSSPCAIYDAKPPNSCSQPAQQHNEYNDHIFWRATADRLTFGATLQINVQRKFSRFGPIVANQRVGTFRPTPDLVSGNISEKYFHSLARAGHSDSNLNQVFIRMIRVKWWGEMILSRTQSYFWTALLQIGGQYLHFELRPATLSSSLSVSSLVRFAEIAGSSSLWQPDDSSKFAAIGWNESPVHKNITVLETKRQSSKTNYTLISISALEKI